ncbi:MAG: cystathionine beta-lyase [Hyphomicrobiaceae bacterium]
MTDSTRGQRTATRLAHAGRDPKSHEGFVNTPVYRGSTIIHPTVEILEAGSMPVGYGRKGTPTVRGLEESIAELEGGVRTMLVPSGLSAVTSALLTFVEAGDHILMTDSVYRPTRMFCDTVLKRIGIETEYYDPLVAGDIASLIRDNTRLVYTESPGSQTFEVQDISAISAAAHARGALVLVDNTWASPLYFKPFDHGADVSIQAATKYIVGHSDAMLGSITTTTAHADRLAHDILLFGNCAGSEEAYLGQRGFRTMDVRLQRHWENGLTIARWLEGREEVARVLHPALPSHPQHDLWKRDFLGASGLFTILLHDVPKKAVAAMLDDLAFFGMGFSWGGFESLIVPFDPSAYRTATTWEHRGPNLRLHIGLEDPDDLMADLDEGFARLRDAA